jgi:hypothetical protein
MTATTFVDSLIVAASRQKEGRPFIPERPAWQKLMAYGAT